MNKTIGKSIKEKRIEQGLSQQTLANLIGVTHASISYWENARQEPSASAIVKLAQFFDVTADYLLGIIDE